MFRRKWRIVRLISYTKIEILAEKYWTKSGAQRVAKALNEGRPGGIATLLRVLGGDDTYVVRTDGEMRIMARMYEERKSSAAAAAAQRLDEQAREKAREKAQQLAVEHLEKPLVAEFEPPMRVKPRPPRPLGEDTGRLNHGGPVKGAKITRIDRDGSDDEGTSDGGFWLRGEPRAEALAPEHNVGRDLSCDVPAQGASGSDRVSDGGYSAGGSSSSDGGSGGSDCSAGSSDSW